MPRENHLEAFIEHLQKQVEYSRSTKTTYASVVKRFLKYISEDVTKVKVTQITPDKVNEFVTHIQHDNAIDSQVSIFYAIRKYLLFLQREYGNKTYDYYRQIDINNIGIPRNEKVHNPLTPQRNTKSTRQPLTKQELDKLFEVSKSNPRDYAILMTFYYTGQRRDSIFHINVSDIDRENKELKVYAKGKNGLPRVYHVAINDDVLKAIDKYLKIREKPIEGFIVDNWGTKLYHKDSLFLNGTGGRYTHAGFYHMIKKYANIIGLKKSISPHHFRHTMITSCDESGMTEAQICLQSGHTNSQSLRRYIHPDLKRTKPLIDKALSRKPTPPEKPESIPPQPTIAKPKQTDTTDSYISKDIQDTLQSEQIKLLIELENKKLANKDKDIEILKLKQNHSEIQMYG